MSVARIKAAVNLHALAREHATLVKSGRDWLMLCPWHTDSKPSLRVYKDHCYCFACNRQGSAIDFLMAIEGLSFGSALRRLSDRTGIPLDDYVPVSPIKAAYNQQEREFAIWWQRRTVDALGLRVTAHLRMGSPEAECDAIGAMLKRVREACPTCLGALAVRLATAEDRRAWDRERTWDAWFSTWFLSLAELPCNPA